MVVSAQNVDSFIITTGNKLVIMISDIRHNICRKTVSPYKNYILIIAVFACFKPQCAVLLISYAFLLKCVNNPLNRAVIMKC